MYVDYSPGNFLFSVEFNGEAVPDYNIPDGTPDIVFKTVEVTGDIIINYIGFGEPGI